MNLQEKQNLVTDLQERFQAAEAAFVVSTVGCTCAEVTGLRRELRAGGANLAVIKNTLAERAVKGTDAEVLSSLFKGPVAVIWSKTDAVSSAKVLAKFAKSLEKLQIKGGLVDGQLIPAAEVDALASLPSREELLAKLLSLINAPATRLLQTINAAGTQMACVINARKEQLEKQGSTVE